MTSEWKSIYEQVSRIVKSARGDTLFFRGHADATWPLHCGLARRLSEATKAGVRSITALENTLYFRFATRSGDLFSHSEADSWSTLFAMQHFGLPTRLLDWSRSFSIALYFAVRDARETCCVWVVDPARLNERSHNRLVLGDASTLPGSYDDFTSGKISLPGDVIALLPVSHQRRLLQQRAAFTLHANVERPLEDLYPELVTKVSIPAAALHDARDFLSLAGISEFALFPDLDGLAREIWREILQ